MQELHDVYYEPLAQVLPSLTAILQGPPIMKLLFMTDPRIVDAKLKPDWTVSFHTCLPLLPSTLTSASPLPAIIWYQCSIVVV